jgi:phospholipid transport system substrate-binding protein
MYPRISGLSRRLFSGLLFGVSLTLSFAATATAAPAASAESQADASQQSPDQMIRSTTDQLRGLIRQNVQTYRNDKPAFYKAVDDTLVPHFDSTYIAQLVLGRHWRTANADQKKKFESAFKSMLIHGYGDALLEYYDSVRIELKPARYDDRHYATVDTLLYRPNVSQPTSISFKLRQVDGQWKVFDVIVENISLVLNFRTQVDAEIKRTSLDDVIARMEKGEVFKPKTPVNAQHGGGAPG